MREVVVTLEAVKSAVGAAIAGEFPGEAWYREQTANTRYPHFFVSLRDAELEPDTKNRWWLTCRMNARYRVEPDPHAVKDLSRQLGIVALRLACCLERITLSGKPYRTRNLRWEPVDGVLQVFFDVKIRLKKPVDPEPLMRVLDENLLVRE